LTSSARHNSLRVWRGGQHQALLNTSQERKG